MSAFELGNKPEERWYYRLNTGINQIHYHIQKSAFLSKFSTEYEGYETWKQLIVQGSV